MSEMTSTENKIMAVFRYYRIGKGDSLSQKLLSAKSALWQDADDEGVRQALASLQDKKMIEKRDGAAAYFLAAEGEAYLGRSND